MTTDMAAAEKFYKPVVGSTTTPFDGAGMPYRCGRGVMASRWAD